MLYEHGVNKHFVYLFLCLNHRFLVIWCSDHSWLHREWLSVPILSISPRKCKDWLSISNDIPYKWHAISTKQHLNHQGPITCLHIMKTRRYIHWFITYWAIKIRKVCWMRTEKMKKNYLFQFEHCSWKLSCWS
jgi:hypothetical protein